MMLRVLLIDDEPLALRRLRIALGTSADCEVVGEARDGESAKTMIAELQPDLIFVDIQMPGMSGLELVETLDGKSPPAVIFVTAFEKFALDAFENGAIDYLLKPIDENRLATAVERAKRARLSVDAEQQIASLRAAVAELKKAHEQTDDPKRLTDLWIHQRGMSLRVPLREVRMFEAAGDYVMIHTGDQELLHYDSLRGLEERLNPDRFMRIHRSGIVALPFVETIEKVSYGRLVLHLDNGKEARCSRTYRSSLQQRLASAD